MTIVLHLDDAKSHEPLWRVLEQPETAVSDCAHWPVTGLMISSVAHWRLRRAGIRTVGKLLSCTCHELRQIAQFQWALAELVGQLGAFLGVDARLVEESDFNSGLITVLTNEMILTASPSIFSQLARDVSLASLCAINVSLLADEDLARSINDARLNLKARSRRCLLDNGVQTVFDLLQPRVTVQQLIGLPNMGVGSVWDVLIHLHHFCHRDRSLASKTACKSSTPRPASFSRGLDRDLEDVWQGSDSLARALARLDDEVPLRHLLNASRLPFDILAMPITSPRLDFSIRPYNCLRRAHCKNVDDVLNFCLRELLAMPNMGAGSVYAIVSTLSRLCRRVDTAWTMNGSKIDASPQEDVPAYVCRIMAEAPERKWTLDEVAACLATDFHLDVRRANARVRALPQLRVLANRVVWLDKDDPRALAVSLHATCFRTLLDEVLAGVAGERNVAVVRKYFGFDEPHQTLQRLADSSGDWNGNVITRERVRQIIEQPLARLRKDEAVHALLTAPLRSLMADMGGVARLETVVAETTKRFGGLWGELSIEGYVRFAVALDKTSFQKFTVSKGDFPSRHFILTSTVKRESLQRLIERAKERLNAVQEPIDDESLGLLLVEWWPSEMPDVAPPLLHRTQCLHLDYDLELKEGCWQWRSTMRGRKLTLIDHLVAIMRENREPMHFTQIAAAFRERVRDIKDNGVHGRLSAQPELFALVKSGTFGLVELGYVKVRWIRDIMADFLRRRGTPATIAEIQAAVWAERDANASSIIMTLSVPDNNRGLFKRFPDHRWGLAEWEDEAASTRGGVARRGRRRVGKSVAR